MQKATKVEGEEERKAPQSCDLSSCGGGSASSFEESASLQNESSSSSFPAKLMQVLENPEYEDAIWWNTSGKEFQIAQKAFSDKVMIKHFQGSKFSSFTRKLHRWGFKRNMNETSTPHGVIAYRHDMFQRGDTDMVTKMRIIPRKERIKRDEALWEKRLYGQLPHEEMSSPKPASHQVQPLLSDLPLSPSTATPLQSSVEHKRLALLQTLISTGSGLPSSLTGDLLSPVQPNPSFSAPSVLQETQGAHAADMIDSSLRPWSRGLVDQQITELDLLQVANLVTLNSQLEQQRVENADLGLLLRYVQRGKASVSLPTSGTNMHAQSPLSSSILETARRLQRENENEAIMRFLAGAP